MSRCRKSPQYSHPTSWKSLPIFHWPSAPNEWQICPLNIPCRCDLQIQWNYFSLEPSHPLNIQSTGLSKIIFEIFLNIWEDGSRDPQRLKATAVLQREGSTAIISKHSCPHIYRLIPKALWFCTCHREQGPSVTSAKPKINYLHHGFVDGCTSTKSPHPRWSPHHTLELWLPLAGQVSRRRSLFSLRTGILACACVEV